MGEALLFQKFSAISSAVCLLVPRCELSAAQATVLALPLSWNMEGHFVRLL